MRFYLRMNDIQKAIAKIKTQQTSDWLVPQVIQLGKVD